jgi:hypothetical protein
MLSRRLGMGSSTDSRRWAQKWSADGISKVHDVLMTDCSTITMCDRQ